MKQKIKNALKGLLFVAAVALVGLQSPRVHREYIDYKVNDNVVMLRAPMWGGTGFVINTPSGGQVTMTNAHVCGDEPALYAINEVGEIKLRVLEVSKVHDLCILERTPGHSGLDLGWEPSIGDSVFILGHPYLLPKTLTYGEVSSKTSIPMVTGMVDPDRETPEEAREHCKRIERGMFGELYCVNEREVIFVTAPSAPGNSGSPVVNNFGNVVGVLFAGYQTGASNLIVPAKFIKDLIKMY